MLLNFSIPETLYKQIGDYDVTKPKPVKAKKERTAPTFPKAGIPENLIPPEIFPKEMLLEAINTLNNTQTNSYSSRSFEYDYNENKILITKKYNKFWSAIWFNPQDDEVIFNYTLCLRDLKSYKRDDYYAFTENCEDFSPVIHNKKNYLYYSKTVTKEVLKNKEYNSTHFIGNFSREFGEYFKPQLKKAIQIWDRYYIFEWYRNSLASVCSAYDHKNDFSWVPTFDWVFENNNQELKEKFSTPFLKKKINQKLQNIVDFYNSSSFNYLYGNIFPELKLFSWVESIYGEEFSIDYYQQVWNTLKLDEYPIGDNKFSHFYGYTNQMGIDWLKKNVPISSFINMLSKDFENLKDAVSMVFDVIRYKEDISYEGRWRVDDFHDWIMGENWKLTNKDQHLPQDLFPTPVKVEDITFIQPRCTHELSKWGRAARNCVGNSTYYDGVLRKNHFIVLALEKGNPHLTIQAKLENQNLKIIQVKKSCNANLTSFETAYYHKLFEKALQIRSQEVQDAVC